MFGGVWVGGLYHIDLRDEDFGICYWLNCWITGVDHSVMKSHSGQDPPSLFRNSCDRSMLEVGFLPSALYTWL